MFVLSLDGSAQLPPNQIKLYFTPNDDAISLKDIALDNAPAEFSTTPSDIFSQSRCFEVIFVCH
jgi:hypothetical protein